MNVKICGHDYIIVSKELEGDTMASINYYENVISVSSKCSPSQREESILHEVLHGILMHHTGSGDHSESDIQAIASGLFQMGVKIPDNG